jgi:hypothetical protein
VDFLLHLAEFDDRRAFAGAGYPSLWAYCTEVLHLREGATWRRIEAMKLLRRFPIVEAPLRTGALCLTTVNLLGPVLTEENVADLTARAAFLSKIETERLVASLRPREAPADGFRKVTARAEPQTLALVPGVDRTDPEPAALVAAVEPPPTAWGPSAVSSSAALPAAVQVLPLSAPAPRTELRPVAKDAWSLRVTLDDAARAELLELAALTAHSTRGDLAAVLRDAVRCALAKHGKRRGAVRPERERKAAPAAVEPSPPPAPLRAAGELSLANEPPGAVNEPSKAPDPRAIPMAVRQAVWDRDRGRCAWVSPGGKRCGSTWQLQLGHIQPVALGGQATVEDLRLECAAHNQYEAIRVFGRRHMSRFLPGLRSRRRK